LACALAGPTGFGYQYELKTAPGFSPGYTDAPAQFAHMNLDGRADFCRFRGDPNNRHVSCDLADASGYSGSVWNSAPGVDLGYSDTPRAFVDVSGDGIADYCRFRGAPNNRYITCDIAGAAGYVSVLNSYTGVYLGDSALPRAFVDVNGDGRADFCRLRPADSNANSQIVCDLATASGFAKEAVQSFTVDVGYGDAPRLFGDVDGDGRADFCRFRGDPSNRKIQCNVANTAGEAFKVELFSYAGISPGLGDKPASLIDVNKDGKADFCHFRSVNNQPYLQCNLANAALFQTDAIATFKSAFQQ
jgi:hypothetical protein